MFKALAKCIVMNFRIDFKFNLFLLQNTWGKYANIFFYVLYEIAQKNYLLGECCKDEESGGRRKKRRRGRL